MTGSLDTSTSDLNYWQSNVTFTHGLAFDPLHANMTTDFGHNSDEKRYTECNLDLMACRAQKYLFLVGGPIIILLSTVGNGLGLAVMSRKSLRNTATALFISCLAISDTVAVWTAMTRHFTLKLTMVGTVYLSIISYLLLYNIYYFILFSRLF